MSRMQCERAFAIELRASGLANAAIAEVNGLLGPRSGWVERVAGRVGGG